MPFSSLCKRPVIYPRITDHVLHHCLTDMRNWKGSPYLRHKIYNISHLDYNMSCHTEQTTCTHCLAILYRRVHKCFSKVPRRLHSLVAGVQVAPSNNHISLICVDVCVQVTRREHAIFHCQFLLCLDMLLCLLRQVLP